MAVFKCKMCGGSLDIPEGTTRGKCPYCDTIQTIPRLDDERRVNLYDRANHFRRNNDFDKAAGIYEQILNEDNTDAEAYWSLVLCRFGIEYVEDPTTHRRVPTVNRAQYTSIYDDDNYKSAMSHAVDTYQRGIYEEEANAINEIQKGILAISQKEEPFDVFICYKETDNNGRRTQDSVLATDLYHQLTQEGFKVFFSRITLEDKLGQEYEPYIFAALNSAKVMVVLGTRQDYFNAVWVKNEWSRYLSLVKDSAGKKILIPAYKDMDPYDLPEEFSHLQAQDMSKLGFMQDLIRGIKKILETDEPGIMQKEVVVSEKASVEPLLKRVYMFLEDGDWKQADEYCERVLDQDPENAKAYLGKLMAELRVKRQEDLEDCEEPFNNRNNYQKAVRFGGKQLASVLSGYIDHINERNENTLYNNAVSAMKSANSEALFMRVADTFKTMPGFKDADSLAELCIEKAEEHRKLAEEKKEEKKEKMKRKSQAVVRAMKKELGKPDPTLKERLEETKTRVGYLERILNDFDTTQSQIRVMENDYNALVAQEKQLADQRSRLGIFAGKEKKRIDEELVSVSARKRDLAARIDQNKKSLGNYTSVADIERDLREAGDNVKEVEAQIESARENPDYEYSFEEALDIYLNQADVAAAVNVIYPTASFVPALYGKTNIVKLGEYVQEKGKAPEPIEWKVLAIENYRILVLSRFALEFRSYNTSNTSVTWKTCSLRKWLNETFLNDAFSENEKAMISSVTVSNDKNPDFRITPGVSTTDQVFLLSISEAEKYFSSDSARECYFRTSKDNRKCAWWLRTPGSKLNDAAEIGINGKIYTYGSSVSLSNLIAVRPALWINLGS